MEVHKQEKFKKPSINRNNNEEEEEYKIAQITNTHLTKHQEKFCLKGAILYLSANWKDVNKILLLHN